MITVEQVQKLREHYQDMGAEPSRAAFSANFVAHLHEGIKRDQGALYTRHFKDALVHNEALNVRTSDPSYLGGEWIGAGDIGKPCARALWYGFRWTTIKEFDAKALLIFSRGQLEEARFAAMLRAAGAVLWTHDERGRQFSGQVGFIKGKPDGVARSLPCFADHPVAVEFKTHGASFAKLVKEGVQKSKPEHYTQVQISLHTLNLQEGLYLASCKENEDLWAEVVPRNNDLISSVITKAHAIATSHEPPPRINNATPSYFMCRFCDHRAVCFTGEIDDARARSCRTCEGFRHLNGATCCTVKSTSRSHQEQFRGCSDHHLTVLK